MISATADTNIYISGLQFKGLNPRPFLDLAAEGAWSRELLRETEEEIRSFTHHVAPTQTVSLIAADPSDNRILECAVAASSQFIVSGDTRHVLPLGSHAGISMVTVADFPARLHRLVTN